MKQDHPQPDPFCTRSILGKITWLPEDEQRFLEEMLDLRYADQAPVTLQEITWRETNKRYGFQLYDVDSHPEFADDVNALILMRRCSSKPGAFLHRLLKQFREAHEEQKNFTLDDIAYCLQNDMQQIEYHVQDAREVLHENPELLAAELREIAKKRPDLFSGE